MTWDLLRGRVAIRQDDRVSSIIHDPWADRESRLRQQKSHRGVVVAMGAPAQTPIGAEGPTDFKVGDKVEFVFGAPNSGGWGGLVESARQGWWGEERVVWCAMEEIIAVWDEP